MNTLFNKIIFIHCKHRLDRFQNIQNFISKFNLTNYHILEATYLPKNGAKGCSHSHYRAMEYCLENNLKNVLILEDDYWIDEDISNVNKRLEEIFTLENWDVIMLDWFNTSPLKRSLEVNKNLRKLIHPKYGWSLTSAYAVNKNFFEKLKISFKESYDLFPDIYIHEIHKKYACDYNWFKLQKNNNWFIIYPKIGLQSEKLVSDISKNRINI
jgi:GR25 family glycosyltransferase involved in LPS biosynthesis